METLYTLAPEIVMIAGHQTTIPFEVKRADGGEVDLTLSGTVIKWILSDYGMPICAALTLTNETSSITVGTPPSCFDVYLSSSNSYGLSGTYTYQIEITSPIGDVFRPIEGILVIKARNYEED